jgi:hypothetical protein
MSKPSVSIHIVCETDAAASHTAAGGNIEPATASLRPLLATHPEPPRAIHTEPRAIVEGLSHVLELVRYSRQSREEKKWGRTVCEAALNLCAQINGELTSIASEPRGFARVHTPSLERFRDPTSRHGLALSNTVATMKAQRQSTVVQDRGRTIIPEENLAKPHSGPHVALMHEARSQALPVSQSAPQFPQSHPPFGVPARPSTTTFAVPLEDSAIYGGCGSSSHDTEEGAAPRHLLQPEMGSSGQLLPIVLPGKLQWVRDTHRRLGIPKSRSLSVLGVRAMPSEAFFGPYDDAGPIEDLSHDHSRKRSEPAPSHEDSLVSVERVTSKSTSRGTRLAPIVGDDGIAASRPRSKIRADEKRKQWSVQSFDRVKFHG